MKADDDEQLTPGTLYEWHEVEYGDERKEIILCFASDESTSSTITVFSNNCVDICLADACGFASILSETYET